MWGHAWYSCGVGGPWIAARTKSGQGGSAVRGPRAVRVKRGTPRVAGQGGERRSDQRGLGFCRPTNGVQPMPSAPGALATRIRAPPNRAARAPLTWRPCARHLGRPLFGDVAVWRLFVVCHLDTRSIKPTHKGYRSAGAQRFMRAVRRIGRPAGRRLCGRAWLVAR